MWLWLKFSETRAEIGKRPPLLEMKGSLARVDLSAWISGLSYVLGMGFIGGQRLGAALQGNSIKLIAVVFCLAVFFFAVARVQHYMGLPIRAKTFGKPQQLVTSGPYTYSRNPIYVAFLLPLASFVVFSPWAALAAITVYITAMNLTVLRKEERDLAQLFGQTYADYAAKVPRWIV